MECYRISKQKIGLGDACASLPNQVSGFNGLPVTGPEAEPGLSSIGAVTTHLRSNSFATPRKRLISCGRPIPRQQTEWEVCNVQKNTSGSNRRCWRDVRVV